MWFLDVFLWIFLVFAFSFIGYLCCWLVSNILDLRDQDKIRRFIKYPFKLFKRFKKYLIKKIQLSKTKKSKLINQIIKEIKENKEFNKCFWDVEYEVKNWSLDKIKNYKLD